MSPLLADLLPDTDDPAADDLLDRFLEYTTAKGLRLYPAQEEAILELLSEKHWTLVYLMQHPGWRGEGVLIDARNQPGRATTGLVLIPSLAFETRVYLRRELPLDSIIPLALNGVNSTISQGLAIAIEVGAGEIGVPARVGLVLVRLGLGNQAFRDCLRQACFFIQVVQRAGDMI